MRKVVDNEGVVGTVDAVLPRYDKRAGWAEKPIRVNYYEGETAEDAERFVAAIAASWSAYREREAKRKRPEPFTGKVRKVADVSLYRSTWDGSALASWHKHDGRPVRVKYTSSTAPGGRSIVCPVCWDDRAAYAPKGGHNYEPIELDKLPFSVPAIALDESKWLPEDLYTPANHPEPRALTPRVKVEPVAKAATPRKAAPRPVRKASVPVMAPAIVARDGGKLAPCERCGRADWRTEAGRTWHVENNPDCAKYRKPERHVYAIGA